MIEYAGSVNGVSVNDKGQYFPDLIVGRAGDARAARTGEGLQPCRNVLAEKKWDDTGKSVVDSICRTGRPRLVRVQEQIFSRPVP